MRRPLALDELRARVEDGTIDTVVVAFTDMQGRLQGKRLHGRFFVDEVLEHGTEGCNYLLAVDVDMNTVDGYAISSWERGYGDMEFALDLSTLRLIPWQPGTAMVQCDLRWIDEEHRPVRQAPRTILAEQVARAAERDLVAFAGTELEFLLFDTTYEQAWTSGYRELSPANQYNVDYSILGTSRVDTLLREIQNGMYLAGLTPESIKGECNLGQHEIAFRYDEVIRTADQHSVYKNGAKEIAAQHGKALTFMAKYDEREGNSCHIHMSLRGSDGSIVFDSADGPTELFESFVAGVQATLSEFTLLYAPNINSYKRFAPGSFAPTAI
ncbi:MAG: glutamine synthetase family protein, partial [Actinomycetota bacterium]|nr:glutamine synthetase family protein [Actinomycetota bacterium]